MQLVPTTVIAWVGIGLLVGWLAALLFKGSGFGLLADLLIGLAGAITAGVILSLFGGVVLTQLGGLAGLIGSFVAAVIGAIILLWLIRVLSGGTRRTAL
jgi:uncharacterized membrane protein YeaQ/YmgE (transglycosylase-associated protein family)